MRHSAALKKLRADSHETIEQVVSRTGVPNSTYSKWEVDGIPNSVRYAVILADAFGVEVRDLFDKRK